MSINGGRTDTINVDRNEVKETSVHPSDWLIFAWIFDGRRTTWKFQQQHHHHQQQPTAKVCES